MSSSPGLGAITPLGHTVADYWDGLKGGKSGLGPITLAGTPEELTQKVVAEIKGFDPLKHFEERELPTLDRVSQIRGGGGARGNCAVGH